MRMLRACLNDEPLPRLMAMADLWDVALDASSAREVAEALAGHMLQAEVMQQARSELPAEAQDALGVLLKSNGRMPSATFERRFGAVRPMGPGKLERKRPWMSPVNVAEVLWYRGWCFRAFDRVGVNPSEMFFIPTDLFAVVGGTIADVQTRAAGANPVRVSTTDAPISHSTLIDDITTILVHIQNTNVVVRTDGEWQLPARRAVQPMLRDSVGVLGEKTADRFQFLLHVIERMGWVRVQNNRARLIPQPVTHWLQLPLQQQRESLLNAWLHDPDWNDLAHVAGLSLEMTHTWANQPMRERGAIVDLLAQWLETTPHASSSAFHDNFIAYVKLTHPDFARSDGRYDTWHVRDVATDQFLMGFEHWNHVEGALIRYLLSSPLRWLEHLDNHELPRTEQPLLVRENGQALVSVAHPFERFQLGRVADWVSNETHVITYRLSPRSLARASEQGIQAARVIEFLEKTSTKPVPGNISKAIQRWAERGSEARLEPVRLLRTRDAQSLDVLLNHPSIRRAMLERIAPNGLLIRERDAAEVLAAAAQSGVLLDESSS